MAALPACQARRARLYCGNAREEKVVCRVWSSMNLLCILQPPQLPLFHFLLHWGSAPACSFAVPLAPGGFTDA